LDDDPYRTLSQVSLGEPTSAGSRFRVLRPHAKGGLGQVSVAIDQELDRPVALKEIQDCHADEPHSRARFVQEAEITGKLEHPGIIPVYGLGHDASGRPFYAMRFIQGDSLKEAIAAFHGDGALKRDAGARSLRLRDLLRRFTDVCNAVAYAHARGVLHRDLKPGNIMLGPYGETLVVDWGLAKPLGRSSSAEPPPSDGPALAEGPIRLSALSGSRAETVAGSLVGTPAYASPEQVAGRLDLLGPHSDVYGLGATLYALLTGRPPVEANEMEEVLRRVQKGAIPPPRSIDPTIPRPLEAVCLKALAMRPEDRYASARELARDIENWLADEAVSAWREPISQRARRWARRHRTAVAAAMVALLVGVVGLGAVATVQAQANRELQAANTATTKAKNEAVEALAET
jgi:serine/threonine-protein kinase